MVSLGGLALGTEYLFGIMSFNNLGDSNYTTDIVKAKTSSKFSLKSCYSVLMDEGILWKIFAASVSIISIVPCKLFKHFHRKLIYYWTSKYSIITAL